MKSFRFNYLALPIYLLASSCIYANVNTPLSYRSPTASDVGGIAHLGQQARGEACNHAILGLVAWGNAGYDAAMQDAKISSNAQVLADVRADVNLFNVLGVYQSECTIVTAQAVH